MFSGRSQCVCGCVLVPTGRMTVTAHAEACRETWGVTPDHKQFTFTIIACVLLQRKFFSLPLLGNEVGHNHRFLLEKVTRSCRLPLILFFSSLVLLSEGVCAVSYTHQPLYLLILPLSYLMSSQSPLPLPPMLPNMKQPYYTNIISECVSVNMCRKGVSIPSISHHGLSPPLQFIRVHAPTEGDLTQAHTHLMSRTCTRRTLCGTCYKGGVWIH